MAVPVTQSIVCPILIGRQPHLDSLIQFIEQIYSGHGQTILVSGEAGIGKSRLIAEAIKYTRASHSQAASPTPLILEGRCFEPDRSLPYAPFLDLLRSFLSSYSPQDLVALLGPTTSELSRLLPEFAAFVPELVTASPLDPEQEKRRLFQALLHFFTRLAALQPLVVVLEDIHWSDDTSLEYLLFLVRHIASHPILLLLTYRSEEEHPALLALLAGLDRERLTTELTLSHLTINEVEVMIRTILGLPRAVNADFIAAIYTPTEGNPFFIEEMLKSLVTSGVLIYNGGRWERKPRAEESPLELPLPDHPHLPRNVQLAVQQRLNHLSVEARDVLSFAAVVGRRFDFTLLQHLTGRNEAELVRLVKELIIAQLIVEESEDVLAFRHALTRQAAYTDLLVRERRSLHYSVAQTMERIYTNALDDCLGDLAYHFYMARKWAKVLEYAQRAGEKAQALYAPRVAIEQYSRALEAIQQLAQVPAPGLYRARAQCYESLGDSSAARADYTRALETARGTHDSVMEWQSMLDLGYLWTGLDYTQAGSYLHSALALARTMNDPFMLARTLNRVGNWHMNLEEPLEGQRYHLEALSIFSTGSDQHGLAEALDFLGVASLMSGDLIASARYYEQAVALWRTLADRQGLLSSLVFFAGRGGLYFTSTVVPFATSEVECIRDEEEAIALSHQLGTRSSEAFALIFLGLCLGYRGEYERALSSAETGLNIAIEIEHGPWMATGYLLLGIISLELLALPTARQHLERALALAKECGSLFLLRNAAAFLASTCIAQDEYTHAEAILDNMFGPETPCQTIAQRLVWRTRAELELARTHPDRALAILDQLISTAAHVEDGEVIPHLWHLRGKVLVALGKAEEAETVLCSARDAAQRQGLRPLLWRICVTLGRLYRTQAQREQAEEAFSLARTMIEELASSVTDRELRDNFLRYASVQLPHRPQPSPRQAARQAFGGLTGREREVAVLIARGKSNRVIADELVVSERTIEKHVERIMFRLGFSSRTQIAAWVVEKGLLNSSH
ncbi:MAG TPA: AAA family ATPase [Ktedonobacteraceae bacterium]|nr:AAA family ATPase [Ktedonobacteraceae bacterium]